MQCHAAGKAAFPVTECGRCHKQGKREDWLKSVLDANHISVKNDDIDGTRPQTSVRACGSQGNASADKKFKRKTPCFKHETSGHRMTNDNKDVQCKQCHHMIADEANWGGKTFRSIADLHINKIIGTAGKEVSSPYGCAPGGGVADKNDAQHAACSGGTACHEHAKAVDLDCPTNQRNCVLCHAQRTNNEAF
jgi:RecJ-like exonuclease